MKTVFFLLALFCAAIRCAADAPKGTVPVSNHGTAARVAPDTPIGRYQKALEDAIGRCWYQYVEKRMDVVSAGEVNIHFFVTPSGKVKNVRVSSGKSGSILADISIRAVSEAPIPPMPPEIVDKLDNGQLEYDLGFGIYESAPADPLPKAGTMDGVKHRHTPQPPYPLQARAVHLTGSSSVSVSFDASGHVSSATISQSAGSAILDNNTIKFAKANWRGPPNSQGTFRVTYSLPIARPPRRRSRRQTMTAPEPFLRAEGYLDLGMPAEANAALEELPAHLRLDPRTGF